MKVGDFPIKGKIVVVTGGGSGINFSFVKKAVAEGCKVIIGDLTLTPEASKWFDKESKSSPVFFEKCDVTKWDQLKNLVTVSLKHFSDVPDVYVAGAGVFEPKWSNFWDDTEMERYAEMDINASHPIKLTRIAMQSLAEKNKKGVVLSLASIAGLQGTYSAALYCASKHAVVGFTKSMTLADELEGVKVATICPGLVYTPLWTDRHDAKQALDRFGVVMENAQTPDQVADLMLEVIQEGKYTGGAVVECTVGGSRIIPEWNISPPPGVGSSVPREVLEKNVKPMRDIMSAYRQKAPANL
ncbi:NAD(P)-binding protein [Patellaria atrata CBS 101060]|uniref:NAD(P)-binding protein n=1 Tax=Patellaria atrata CBS 101060 TaxID=1346257 RepID=A0A9P4S790_9PEZI|nr:NAD(P)-binding protein [Patellaria atrata CBS 101060]